MICGSDAVRLRVLSRHSTENAPTKIIDSYGQDRMSRALGELITDAPLGHQGMGSRGRI